MPDQLALMAGDHPDADAFVDLGTGGALSFAAWDDAATRVAGGLAAAGVRPDDRVALLVDTDEPLRFVVAHAGIHRAGAVAVPVNTRLTAAEIGGILRHAEPAAVIVSPSLAGRLAATGVPLPVVVGTASAPEVPAGVRLGWEQLVAAAPRPAVERGPEDLADILYTSGTTGAPKGVVVRHGNASMLPDGVPRWSGDGWLACSPLFTFAGMNSVQTPMRLGMTALHLPRFDPARWLQVVEERRPTMVFLVPAMAELLLAHPGVERADLSSIGLCAVGSAPLAPETQRRLARLMPAASVSNAYGMTEAGPAYTVLPKEETERRAGSVGRPLPPAEMFAVDDDGRRLPPGAVGELVIRLPGRPREYFRDPGASAAMWRDDGLHTGDLARIDEDGYVYIVGRAKDVVIRGGHNVHTADVEAVLYEHPDVAEAVVAGVPHPVLGEDVAAWVVLRPGASSGTDELLAWAAERLADYKAPRRIAVVDHLPRNATGKVVRSELPPPPPAAR